MRAAGQADQLGAPLTDNPQGGQRLGHGVTFSDRSAPTWRS
jgi:hypothetical protein